MKKHYLLTLAVSAALFCACNNGTQTPEATALADSVLVDEPLENEEVTQLLDIVNSVAECLDSIQVQEDMIFKLDEATPKEQILARLNAFQDLLNRKQQQINKLSGQNKSNKVALANFQKMVDYLNLQLKEKSEQIAKLEEAVETKDAKISELRYDLHQATAESDYLKDQNFEQDQQLNQAFYIVAEKKELKELGLMSGGGLTKKRANYANIDQSKFKKVDVRGFTKLVIESKSPKLITEKPASSYTLTKNDDGTSTLQITDAKAFWTASPYLIIQK